MNAIVKERFIRIHFISLRRPLDEDERQEYEECYKALEKYQAEIDLLQMYQYMATETNDMEWLDQICNEYSNLTAKH